MIEPFNNFPLSLSFPAFQQASHIDPTNQSTPIQRTNASLDQTIKPLAKLFFLSSQSNNLENLNSFIKQNGGLEKNLSLLQKELLNTFYLDCEENDLRMTLQTLRDLQVSLAKKTSKKNKRIKLLIRSTIQDVDKKIGLFAMDRLIAKKKGEKTRNSNVKPSFIYSLLSQDLKGIDLSCLETISHVIARQINEITENPKHYSGKSLQLKPNEKTYPFYSFDTNSKIYLTVDFPFWLELSEDAKKIELFIVADELNKGSYKKVSALHHFTIDLELKLDDGDSNLEQKEAFSDKPINHLHKIGKRQYLRNYQYFPKVLHEPNGESDIDYIDKGIKLQKKILDQCPLASMVPIAKTPKDPAFGTKSLSKNPFHYQEWCNSDLHSLLASQDTLPLDLKSTPKILDLYFENILDVFIDIGESLIHLHKQQIIHKDIKTDNIFLKATGLQDKKVKGLLADFDLSQMVGIGPAHTKLAFYDYLNQNGVVTPFSDIYGTAMCLCATFLTNNELKDPETLLDEENRALILWKILQQNYEQSFQDTPLIKYAELKKPSAKFISNFIEDLKELINNLSSVPKKSVQKIELQEHYREILALKKIMSLIADVVSINKDLRSKFSIEVNEKTPYWISIEDNRKGSKKIEFPDHIEQKSAARTFLKQIGNLQRKERWKHPLYLVFKNPMELENYWECLKNEISMMNVPEVSKLRRAQIFETIQDPKQIVLAHKGLFYEIIQDNQRSIVEKDECNSALRQISILEKALDYAVKLKRYYKEVLESISEQTMPTELFVARLKEIKQTYNLKR